nr:MAG TPA: hypothetical protein [Caudoviricetes sp.]
MKSSKILQFNRELITIPHILKYNSLINHHCFVGVKVTLNAESVIYKLRYKIENEKDVKNLCWLAKLEDNYISSSIDEGYFTLSFLANRKYVNRIMYLLKANEYSITDKEIDTYNTFITKRNPTARESSRVLFLLLINTFSFYLCFKVV